MRTQKYSDKEESLDCSDGDRREKIVRRVEEMGGEHRTGRETGTFLSIVIEIARTDPLHIWILHTLLNLYLAQYRSSLFRETVCPKYKGSVSKHVQTPKVTFWQPGEV